MHRVIRRIGGQTLFAGEEDVIPRKAQAEVSEAGHAELVICDQAIDLT
jgi:hypothetical protein